MNEENKKEKENQRNMAFLCLTTEDFSNAARFWKPSASSAGGEEGDVQHFVEAFRKEHFINKPQEVVCLHTHKKFQHI